MSYSFSISADSKADAKLKVGEAFDGVVSSQPPHAADRVAALEVAGTFIDLLRDPVDGEEIKVSMNGSLGWNHDAPEKFTGAGVGVSAQVWKKA